MRECERGAPDGSICGSRRPGGIGFGSLQAPPAVDCGRWAGVARSHFKRLDLDLDLDLDLEVKKVRRASHEFRETRGAG